MNILAIFFFYKILAKYSLKRTKLHHLKKIFWGACPRTPLANAMHGAKLALANTPTFQKYLNPPPPEMKS